VPPPILWRRCAATWPLPRLSRRHERHRAAPGQRERGEPASNPPYIDTATVNCHTYHYKLSAVDTCGVESVLTADFSGHATTSIAPNAPTNVQGFRLSSSHARVTWSAVVKDVADNVLTIGGYDVFRSSVMKKWDDPLTAVFPRRRSRPLWRRATTTSRCRP